MNNYIIIGFLLGALLITIYFFISRTKGRSKNPAYSQKPAINLTDSELIAQVRQLMVAGKKIEAIKSIRNHTNSSLLDAKNHVENLEKNISVNDAFTKIEKISSDNFADNNHLIIQIKQLLSQGKKIHAIKLVVETRKMGLKEAKDFVDGLE